MSSISSTSTCAAAAASAFHAVSRKEVASTAATAEVARRVLHPKVSNSLRFDNPKAFEDKWPLKIEIFRKESPCPSPLGVESPIMGKQVSPSGSGF